MVRRAAFVLLWGIATLMATGVGLAAVRSVAGQVVDVPSSELLALAPATSGAPQPAGTGEGGSKSPPLELGEAESFAATSTTEVPLPAPKADDSSDADSGDPATTEADTSVVAAPPPPSTTLPPATTTPPTVATEAPASEPPASSSTTTAGTTTTQPPPPQSDDPPRGADTETTYQLVGGWVRVTHSDGVVRLDAAGPASGYTMRISASGPKLVNIAFRSNDHLSRLKVGWRGAELAVDITEEARRR